MLRVHVASVNFVKQRATARRHNKEGIIIFAGAADGVHFLGAIFAAIDVDGQPNFWPRLGVPIDANLVQKGVA